MPLERGYPQLSALMGPYTGMAIYRKFAELNARNLAYMQAEILIMEADLNSIAKLDAQSGTAEEKLFSKEVWKLREPGANNLQRRKILELRTIMKEYNEALLVQSQISKLDKAEKCNLEILRDWLCKERGGDGFLSGLESKAWNEEATADLIALSAQQYEGDRFTQWLANTVIPRFHHLVGWRIMKPAPAGGTLGLVNYEDLKIVDTARLMSTVLASVLPTLSIVILYFIRSLIGRLGALVGFSTLFAISVAVFTNARRVEVFSATAAFAAVTGCLRGEQYLD